MGLRKPQLSCWLTVDEKYVDEHKIRSRLLQERKENLLCCTAGSEHACEEALEVIVDSLVNTYPESFIRRQRQDATYLEVVPMGEVFLINGPSMDMTPLETAARIAMEYFNILIRDDDGQHIL
jgi:hypothetical protein